MGLLDEVREESSKPPTQKEGFSDRLQLGQTVSYFNGKASVPKARVVGLPGGGQVDIRWGHFRPVTRRVSLDEIYPPGKRLHLRAEERMYRG